MKISVVICTHNRAELLKRALLSLSAAARPKACTVEIRVVANGCTDSTTQVLREYQNKMPNSDWMQMLWEEEPVLGKSRALNRILPKLDADVVAFVDDDHRVDQRYLEAICGAVHAYPTASILCGRILPDWNGTEPAWVHDRGRYRIYPLPIPRFDLGSEPRRLTGEIAVPGGGNLIVRTEIIRAVGEFSVALGPVGHSLSGGEDRQWVLRALSLGARLQYVPEVTQYHYCDPQRLTLWYLMRKAYQRSAVSIEFGSKSLTHRGVPIYMVRKLGKNAALGLFSLRQQPRRFYFVRTAACLGEMRGFYRRHKSGPTGITNARSGSEEKPASD